jgi:hypothetical protein
MADLSIRRITIAEQAREAAARFVQTGEREANPHAGTAEEQLWRSAFERYVLQFSAAQDTEASA